MLVMMFRVTRERSKVGIEAAHEVDGVSNLMAR